MRVLLTGGGTMGSASPLLSVASQLRSQKKECGILWIGTYTGPEKAVVKEADIPYAAIFSGKLRRYFSWRNFIDPFFIIIGFFQALFIIKKFDPDVILSAGAYVSVPAVWAGRLLGKKIIIHQQDIVPGLANKLMAPFAEKITVTFERSLDDYERSKAVWIGNPIRPELLFGSRDKCYETFGLEQGIPVVLILGGGTGSEVLNGLVESSKEELSKFCQIIHLTGKGKGKNKDSGRYHSRDFLTNEMGDVYAAANIVVARAGLSTLTEICGLGKAAILVPIPYTHQEENASFFKDKEAAVVLDQEKLSKGSFISAIKELAEDASKRQKLKYNAINIMRADAAEAFACVIDEVRYGLEK